MLLQPQRRNFLIIIRFHKPYAATATLSQPQRSLISYAFIYPLLLCYPSFDAFISPALRLPLLTIYIYIYIYHPASTRRKRSHATYPF